MAVQAVDLQRTWPELADRRQVVRQGGSALGGDLQDACLGKAGVHRVGGAQQFQRGAHARWREVVALDLGGADHEHMVLFGGDVDRVARVDQAGGAAQGDFGRMDACHFAAHAAQLAPVGQGAQAAAVEHPVRLPALAGLEVLRAARAVPVQRHLQGLQFVQQRRQ